MLRRIFLPICCKVRGKANVSKPRICFDKYELRNLIILSQLLVKSIYRHFAVIYLGRTLPLNFCFSFGNLRNIILYIYKIIGQIMKRGEFKTKYVHTNTATRINQTMLVLKIVFTSCFDKSLKILTSYWITTPQIAPLMTWWFRMMVR